MAASIAWTAALVVLLGVIGTVSIAERVFGRRDVG